MDLNNKKAKNSLFQIPEVCPSCSCKYNGTKASLVKNYNQGMVVHITCPKCQTSVLSSISLNKMGVLAIGMLTDLGKEDLNLLQRGESITVDDVIEMHEYIERRGYLDLDLHVR